MSLAVEARVCIQVWAAATAFFYREEWILVAALVTWGVVWSVCEIQGYLRRASLAAVHEQIRSGRTVVIGPEDRVVRTDDVAQNR